MKVAIRAACVDDVRGAYRWYEQQRQGLGDEFLQSFARTLHVMREHPLRFRLLGANLRHALTRRFPYRVVYRVVGDEVVGDEVVVLACFHAQRDPTVWTSRQ